MPPAPISRENAPRSLIKQIQKQIEKLSASQESSLVGSAAFLYDFAFAIERTKSVLALA